MDPAAAFQELVKVVEAASILNAAEDLDMAPAICKPLVTLHRIHNPHGRELGNRPANGCGYPRALTRPTAARGSPCRRARCLLFSLVPGLAESRPDPVGCHQKRNDISQSMTTTGREYPCSVFPRHARTSARPVQERLQEKSRFLAGQVVGEGGRCCWCCRGRACSEVLETL